MYTQNVNLFKGNKSNSPSEIQIYELSLPQLCSPPSFSNQVTQPLNMNFEQVKQIFGKSIKNQFNVQPQNRSILNLKRSQLIDNGQFQMLRSQNQKLKRDLTEINDLFEQQKEKYNQLKNLYKEGETMFEMLEEKKVFLERENKQLRYILQNLYKQLHQENQHKDIHDKNKDKKMTQSKIQKVKIGNKKIPVIKVNVPAQTFLKRQHVSSVFSHNSDQSGHELNRQQVSSYKQEVQHLNEVNEQLEKQLMNEVKIELQKVNIINENKIQLNKRVNQMEDHLFSGVEEGLIKQRNNITMQQTKLISSNFKSQPFHIQNQSLTHFNDTKSSIYKDSQSATYFKSKYSILETELKKKDQALRSLYQQCFLLQSEINILKSHQSIQSIPIKQQLRKDTNLSGDQVPFQFSKEMKTYDWKLLQKVQLIKEQQLQKSKINELQAKVNQLNQMCISNVNQTFRINELNDTISKLTRQNSICQEKLISQQLELTRLYKILQNKNSQLSQIYTSLTQSKKSYLIDPSKKKSIDNIFANTPQKLNQFSTNLFYMKGHTKDNSYH